MGVSEAEGITETGIWNGKHLPHRYSPGLVPGMLSVLPNDPVSYCDLGCGEGNYLLDMYARFGNCIALCGVEGTPGVVKPDAAGVVRTADLTEPLELVPCELTTCIEVGEHIPARHMVGFFANLRRAVGRWLILSWALPGHVGYGHVNCQSNETVMVWMQRLGLAFDGPRTHELRYFLRNDECVFLKHTIMVFEKAA